MNNAVIWPPGPFSKQCQSFIAQKRALGYKYKTEEYLLRQFSNYAAKQAVSAEFNNALVVGWASKRPNDVNDKSCGNRFALMRQFALFLAQTNGGGYVPSPYKYRSRTFHPYIYSENQITLIFSVMDQRAKWPSRFAVWTMLPVLFRLLYGCGLRISEALSLTLAQVDLQNGLLYLKHTKGDKERLLPMSDSLIGILMRYAGRFNSHAHFDDYFFRQINGLPYRQASVRSAFQAVLRECDIPHGDGRSGPRVHDFRHTFAVHNLNNWSRNGIDVNVAIPVLSTYLGHNSLSATSQYLRLTADVFPEILSVVENHFLGYGEGTS